MTSSMYKLLCFISALCLCLDMIMAHRTPPARVMQGIRNVNLDTANAKRGVDSDAMLKTLDKRAPADKFILKLWEDPANVDVVDAFMNNSFVWFAARNPDSKALPYYQTYGIQDLFYLIDYIKFKALRLTTIPEDNWDDISAEAGHIAGDASYIADWRKSLINDLKVPVDTIDGAVRSIAEEAYANVLQRHASVDDWFDLHVILIPCLWGWTRLGTAVYNDKSTLNDTIFYNTWVVPNLDPSYANKLSTFLDANVALWASNVDKDKGKVQGKWNALFRLALRLEVALFAASGYPPS